MESGGVGMGGGECRSNDYGDAAYWDARYSSSSSGSPASGAGKFFDWYQTYAALRPLLRARIPAASRVLMLGCGNSRTSATFVSLQLRAAAIRVLYNYCCFRHASPAELELAASRSCGLAVSHPASEIASCSGIELAHACVSS